MTCTGTDNGRSYKQVEVITGISGTGTYKYYISANLPAPEIFVTVCRAISTGKFCEAKKKTSYIKIIQLTKHGCNDGYRYIFAVALAVNSLILNVMFPKVVCL